MSHQTSGNDCFRFYSNSCNKGNACTYRHCMAAKRSNQTCDAWRNYNCKSKNCPLRHLEMNNYPRSMNSQIKLTSKSEMYQNNNRTEVNGNYLHRNPYKTQNLQKRSNNQRDFTNNFNTPKHSEVKTNAYRPQYDLRRESKENEIQFKETANNNYDMMKIKQRETTQKNLQHTQLFQRKNQNYTNDLGYPPSYSSQHYEEQHLLSQRDKNHYHIKSIKEKALIVEEIIEQKVQARIAEIKEKERKEEEQTKLLNDIAKRENNLIEMEERIAKMLQESLQQQKQQFEKEKEELIEQTKQSVTFNDQRSNSEFRANNMNDLDDPLSLKQKSDRPEVDFGRASGEFQILLVGGTETGKSTLINTMVNYFLCGSLEQPKVVIPTKYFKNTESGYSSHHSESASDDVTKSQTTKCLTYTFMHPKNRSLKFVFIDSPGLSDTGGTKQDDLNLEEIINTAINAGALSAIIVIANGTESRVTPSIKNTLVRLGNNLPDELIDRNLLLVLTKCSKISASFSEEAFPREIARPRAVFYMDNQAFCSDPRTWQMDEDAYEGLILKWKQSHRTFDNLLKTITEMSNTSTDSFMTMRDLRNKLKSGIATICQDIANIQKVQDSLEAAQKAAQKTGDDKISFANYTKQETITLKKIIPASYHSTVCTTHFLQDTICHEKCGLEFREGTEADHFRGCYCFRGGAQECTECACGPQSHYHAMVALETKTETIEKVLEDMKAKYDSADADYQKFSADSNTFQSTLNKLQANVDQKYLKIHRLCHDLSKICSRFNFVDELHANIQNMKLEARMIKNGGLRKKSENEIAKLVKLANDLSANQSPKGSFSHSVASNCAIMKTKPPDTSQNLSQKFVKNFKGFKFF